MVTRTDVVAYCWEHDGTIDQAYKDNEWSRLWGIVGMDYCAAYVSTPFWRMGAPLPSLGVADGFLYVPYAVDYARAAGQATEVPGQAQPGDIVLFCWDGVRQGGLGAVGDHVGIVVEHDGGEWVHTIEGNTNGENGEGRGVHQRWRHIGTIACYWRPPVYSDQPATAGPAAEAPDLLPEQATQLHDLWLALGAGDRLARYDGAFIDLHQLLRWSAAEPVPQVVADTTAAIRSTALAELAAAARQMAGG